MSKFIGYIIILFFISCNRISVIDDVEFPIPDIKIAVFCFLTPSDSINASIKEIRTLTNKNKESGIENAVISLKDNNTNVEINLKHIANGGYYGITQKLFKIQANHTYSLQVNIVNYPLLTSTCTVPHQSATFEKITYGDPFSDGNSMRRRIEARWKDVSSTEQKLNYLISSDGKFKDSFSGEIRDSQPILKPNKDITQSDNTFFYTSAILDDVFPKNYYLHTLEPNLYLFEKMAQQMDNISKKGSDSVLGSYQGVISEFTNVQNGYGIFGAYLTTSQTITFK
ncbi:uncharacterized protein DUF4249 [Arcicella aurantiaca]|uniref:Uncharacterized protein DUF4249 n=1 Tax=Arcicella aurantiaca TaxID=591202 RepID=A0A316DN21_9BACT|nr:DUF4249 family protein [Arcicella aurantiaca]PWK19461.1 uncharacterized protein DUF4249 [Arcicella aurantiaca]